MMFAESELLFVTQLHSRPVFSAVFPARQRSVLHRVGKQTCPSVSSGLWWLLLSVCQLILCL